MRSPRSPAGESFESLENIFESMRQVSDGDVDIDDVVVTERRSSSTTAFLDDMFERETTTTAASSSSSATFVQGRMLLNLFCREGLLCKLCQNFAARLRSFFNNLI